MSTWIAGLLSKNVIVMDVHLRGTPYSWPELSCAADSMDSITGYPLPSCGVSLQSIDASIFSLQEMAKDLDYVISGFGTAENVISADGMATLIGQRLQNVNPFLGSAYLLSGITSASSFDVFHATLQGFESVARRLLSACVDASDECSQRFGGQDAWQVWQSVLALADGGELQQCTSRLNWGVASYRVAFAQLAALLLAPSSDMFQVSSDAAVTQSFLPALIYRLQRCNDNDVTALTALYNNLQAMSNTAQSSLPSVGLCAVNVVLRFNIIINEMIQSTGAPSAERLDNIASARLVAPDLTFLHAVISASAVWPKYTPDVSSRDAVVVSKIPAVLFAGDSDVFTPIEAAQLSAATSAPNRTAQYFQRIVGGLHQPMATNVASCIEDELVALATNPNAAPTIVCSAVPSFDFMGIATAPSAIAGYFGTADLWEYSVAAPLIVQSAPPLPVVAAAVSDSEKHAVAGLAVSFSLTWIGILAYTWYRYRQGGGGSGGGIFSSAASKRDFYGQINR